MGELRSSCPVPILGVIGSVRCKQVLNFKFFTNYADILVGYRQRLLIRRCQRHDIDFCF